MPFTLDGPAIVLRGLEKRFGNFAAVRQLSLEVQRGGVFGFLGPNGAGKSTTIRMLCGILRPTGGAGTVTGFDIFSEAEAVKSRIGYMSQKFSLYEDLTVLENIEFFGGIYRLAGEKLRVRRDWVLAMAGLEELRHSRTGALAAGWKQRLALGCAILHEPPILFLDEPTAGVDPLNRRRFWDLIHDQAAAGVTVFITTHYMDEAEYCDRLGLIFNGSLVAIGTPREIKNNFMRGAVIEIRCPRPQEALALLQDAAGLGVTDVVLFGQGLHVFARDASVLPAVRGLIEAGGFAVEHAAAVAPSLEDVFAALTARHRADLPEEAL